MRVLYVNHTGVRSGAEVSLLRLIRALPSEVDPALCCPEGELAGEARELGVPVHAIPEVTASLRLRPSRLPATAAEIRRASLDVAGYVRRLRPDLVHANSTRAGIVTHLAMPRGRPPTVVHVRDCLPSTAVATLSRWLVLRSADVVLANSHHTARCFGGRGRAPVHVVHSPVDADAFDPRRVGRAEARSEIGIEDGEVVAGVVGQLTPWKGQDVAIEALAMLRERRPLLRLLLVGAPKFVGPGARFDNLDYVERLEALVRERGVERAVRFAGERRDVSIVMRAIDLLLVPSWEEPFGLVVVEAMSMGTPVVATAVGGPAEVIDDGVNGRLVPPRRADLWSGAIEELLADEGLRRRLSCEGRRTATAFEASRHAERVVEAYRDCVASGAAHGERRGGGG